jgi:hypothetical protein
MERRMSSFGTRSLTCAFRASTRTPYLRTRLTHPTTPARRPRSYVDGNSKHARAFNCVQRSHQQAFETLPQLLFFTAAAATAYPLTAAANMTLWLIGRLVWTNGYAASGGDPAKRYDHPLAFFIFSSLIAQFFVSLAAAGEIAGVWSAVRGLFA